MTTVGLPQCDGKLEHVPENTLIPSPPGTLLRHLATLQVLPCCFLNEWQIFPCFPTAASVFLFTATQWFSPCIKVLLLLSWCPKGHKFKVFHTQLMPCQLWQSMKRIFVSPPSIYSVLSLFLCVCHAGQDIACILCGQMNPQQHHTNMCWHCNSGWQTSLSLGNENYASSHCIPDSTCRLT